ncbi:MAG: hypothetical protein KDA57_13460 [Planctomycetales bacterium]|nr:hypothetical protein [Planctomycetales bacterium]
MNIASFFTSFATVFMLSLSATSICAHDLPISDMMIVAAAETMHVELVLNAEELSFFPEIDQDDNGLLDPAELEKRSNQISQHIVDCFHFQVGNQPVIAAVHGVVPSIGSHHLTIRAHYAVDAREQAVHLESQLPAITRTSHVVEVTFKRPGSQYAARLDAHDHEVLFDFKLPESKSVALVAPSEPDNSEQAGSYRMLIGFAVMLSCFFLFRFKRRK